MDSLECSHHSKAVLEILTSRTDRISRLRGVGDEMVLGIWRREREVIVDLKTLNRGFLALVKLWLLPLNSILLGRIIMTVNYHQYYHIREEEL